MPTVEPNIVTYHSTNSRPNEAWLAFVVLEDGNQLLVRFSGPDEASVSARAKAWFKIERGRQERLHAYDATANAPTAPEPNKSGWGAPFPAPAESPKSEHGLTGSVWVIHRGLKVKKRVKANELDNYLSQGYEKGGPRTVI